MHVNGWLQDPQGSAQQQYQDTHDNPQTSTSSCHPLQLRNLKLGELSQPEILFPSVVTGLKNTFNYTTGGWERD